MEKKHEDDGDPAQEIDLPDAVFGRFVGAFFQVGHDLSVHEHYSGRLGILQTG